MTENLWTQKACEKCIQRYINDTGHQDFNPPEIALWAEKRGYTLPEPMTGLEILAQKLANSAPKARRKDARTSILYRGMLAFTGFVMGERKNMWFDADGPAASPEKIEQSVRSRKEQALNILVSAGATQEHYALTHPNQNFEKVDLSITAEEVEWRLRGKAAADDEQQQTG
jgi:hypothetical protein